MASVVREFEDINESRDWLTQVKPKSGQHIKIVITDDEGSDSNSNDDWKQAVRGIFGIWKDDSEAIKRTQAFRDSFNSRFQPPE